MQTLQIDAEAAGRKLFDETFAGTLPLLPTWEQQPEAFRSLMRTRASRIAVAAFHLGDAPPEEEVVLDANGDVVCDVGEPETGD